MVVAEAVQIIDDFFVEFEVEYENEAWSTIKTALAKLPNTSTNTGMAAEAAQICPRCKKGAPVICQACYEQILKRVDYR
jgi:hypothetical protein